MTRRLLCALVVLWLSLSAGAWAAEPDADGDGLPDAVEEALGTNPQVAEQPEVVVRDRTRAQGDRVEATTYEPGLDAVAVALANVGEDRWLWRVDFDGPVKPENRNVILYVQADNDTATGRKDARGCDYMLGYGRGRAGLRTFAPDGTETQGTVRWYVAGASLYLCADMQLHQEAGRTQCAAWLLVETLEPYKWADSVDQFPVSGPGESTRPKPVLVESATDSENVQVTWGLDLMRALRDDARNVRLPIEDCRMHGYKFDDMNEYHMPSARVMEGPPYTIEATAPRAGRFWPAFIAYDGGGRQVWTVAVNGQRLGIAVAREDNNRQALFALAQPVDMSAGDVLQVRLVNNEGTARVEDLWLLGAQPEIRKLTREVRYVEAGMAQEPLTGARRGRVTFVTTWPARTKLEYGPTAAYGTVLEEPEAQANHRLWLGDLAADQPKVFWRLTAATPEGQALTETGSFPTVTVIQRFAPTPTGQVALTVRNVQPVALRGWPVTQGVPFGMGVLDRAADLRLRDAAGQEMPLQATELAWWPDGTVKWVLLDFQTDLPASGSAPVTVEYGPRLQRNLPAEGEGIAWDGQTLKAGALALSFEPGGPEGLADIRLDRNGDGQFAANEVISARPLRSQVRMGGKEGTVQPESVKVTQILGGPLHTAVRVDRTIAFPDSAASFSEQYEIHAYLGKPFVRVLHTWTNSNASAEWSDIQSWDLTLGASVGSGAQVALGGVDGARPAQDLILDQPFDNAFAVTAGGQNVTQGEKAQGWLDVAGPQGAVTVAVRDFWQQYPKRLSAKATDGGADVGVGIMPAFAPGTYKISKEGELEDKLFFYLKDDVYHMRQGVGKRHEMLWCFRPGGAGAEEAVAAATALQRPPLAVAPREWVCGTRALTDVLPSSPELGGVYKLYEDQVHKALGEYLTSRERGREFGMLNFGDWWGERGRNWGNIEYDTQHGFYLQYLRSGDPDFFYVGEEACRHNMDVDVVRAHANASRVGGVYAHCIGHTGNYYDHSIGGQATPGGGFSVSHTWVEGYLDDFFLTGDLRGLETARMVADHYDGAYTRNYDYDNGRTSGWHLILTLAMYRATGDPYYLNAARIVVERVKEREMPQGGWARQMMPGHCLCTPRHRGEAAFMVGILLTGLKDYHEITGDERTASMIVRGAKNIIAETWIAERNAMRYTSCPNTSPSAGLSTLVTEGILYGYGLSGDPELGEVAVAGTFQGLLSVGGMGKSFSQQIRVSPHFLAQLRQLRLDELAVQLRGDRPLVLAAKPLQGRPLELVVRPWEGAMMSRARLLAPDGTVATETALDPGQPATTMGIPTPQAGVYRLELTGGGSWGVASYLTPLVVEAGDGVALPGRPGDHTYFVSGVSAVSPTPEGGLKAVGETHVAPLAAAVSLRGFRMPAGTGGTWTVTGPSRVLAPWTQFWFDPGAPTASIRATLEHRAAGAALVLDAGGSGDADGKVVAARWTVDGKPAGEGSEVDVPTPEEGLHTVGLTVTDDAGLTGATSTTLRVPPAWLLATDPAQMVVVEAEDFIREEGGGAVEVTPRVGSVGSMVTKWHAVVGHALTWKVDVPQDGRWWVALRYCTDTPDTRRRLLVDGKVPGQAFADFRLPPTGGFCVSADNWRVLRIGEEDGKRPAEVVLGRGEHDLTLSNQNDGCGLDQVLLIRAR